MQRRTLIKGAHFFFLLSPRTRWADPQGQPTAFDSIEGNGSLAQSCWNGQPPLSVAEPGISTTFLS